MENFQTKSELPTCKIRPAIKTTNLAAQFKELNLKRFSDTIMSEYETEITQNVYNIRLKFR